jgi:hypothetical protein
MSGSPFQPEIVFKTSTNLDPIFTPENFTAEEATTVNYNSTSPAEESACNASTFASVGLFISGVITARFGLWIADLSVNQGQIQNNFFHCK